jgi:TonB family protein
MQRVFPQFPLSFLAASFLQAQNSSFETDASRIVFTTISGPVRNAVVYAPNPVISPIALQQNLSGHGVYKIDLDNGIPYDVRVVRSTGHKILDDAAVEALRTWRFRPHRLVWATIPIEFRSTGLPTSSQYPKEAKAIVIFAPKPEYPLQARAKHWGGSGIILLEVDVTTGQVTSARMLKSMGHQILDEAALSAFRRWRFQPGKASPHVKIPITYTMSGASY